MIKTIFFDFGGVIIKPPNYKYITRWKKQLGINDHPEIVEMLENPNESQLVKDMCMGKVSEDYVWVTMTEKWHINPVLLAQIRRRLLSKRQLNKPMMRLMAELKGSYQTAILSNAGDQSRLLMEQIYHLDRFVDAIIISAEEGVIKPDPRMFEIALERMGAEPGSSLLVDDYEANIMAAQAFGMQGVHFTDTQQAISEVRALIDGRT